MVTTFIKTLNIKQNTVFVTGLLYLVLLLIAPIAKMISPGLGVLVVWAWYLIPGYLLTGFIRKQLHWYERLPISLAITLGLFAPVTLAAIFLRLSLNAYLGLFVGMFAVILASYYFFVQKPALTQAHTAQPGEIEVGNKGVQIALNAAVFLVVATLMFLSLNWPLAGDDLAGLPLYSEVLAQGKIVGTEPFHGTGTPVTPRNELVVQGYQMILLADIGNLLPNDLFLFSRVILIFFSFLALAVFLKAWYQNSNFTLLGLLAWGIYLLASLQFDQDGSNFVTRIYQDKFFGWFTLIPALLVLFNWYIRENKRLYLVLFAFGALGLSLTHPVTYTILLMLIGGFSVLHLILNWSKQTLGRVSLIALVLLVGLSIPIIQYFRYIGPTPIDIAGLSDALEYSRLNQAVNRFRLLLLDNGGFTLHPEIITRPLIIAGLLSTALLIPEVRKNWGTRLTVGAMWTITLLLYIPFTASLVATFVTPYLLWRLAWPLTLLSVLNITQASLKIFDWGADRIKPARWKKFVREYQPALIALLFVILASPSILTGMTEYTQRRAQLDYSTCLQAQDAMLAIREYSADQPQNVLASPRENLCIPGVAGLANVVEYRGLGTLNRLPANQIDQSIQRVEDTQFYSNAVNVDLRLINILESYGIDLLLVDRDRIGFEYQLAQMPQYFDPVFQDEQYTLFAVTDTPEDNLIIAGYDAIRLREWEQAAAHFEAVLDNDPESVTALLGLAKAYAGQSEIQQSLDYLLTARDIVPGEPAVEILLGETYLLQHELEQAEIALKSALNNAPDRQEIWISLGTLQFVLGDRQNAQESLETGFSLGAKPGTIDYHTTLASHMMSIGWYEQADDNFNTAIETAPNFRIQTRYAQSLAKMGRLDDAAIASQEAISLNRWDYQPYAILAQISEFQGDLNSSLEMYERALELNPLVPSVHIRLARLQQEQNGIDEAILYLTNRAQMNPLLPGPHAGLASLYIMQGDYEAAQQEYSIISELMPKNEGVENSIGYLYLIADDYEDAYQVFDNRLQEDPGNIPTLLGLAKVYAANRNIKQEYGLRYSAVLQSPLSSWPYVSLARAYMQSGSWDAAEEELVFVLALNPNQPSSWQDLGDFYQARAEWDSAEKAYLEAINLAPDNPDILISLGYTLWQASRLDAAAIYYQRAIEAGPRQNPAYLDLARIYWQQGKHDQAAELLDVMLSQNTVTLSELRLAIKILTQIGELATAEELYDSALSNTPEIVNHFPEWASIEMPIWEDSDYALEIDDNLTLRGINQAEFLLSASNFYRSQNKPEKAAAALETASSIAPQNVNVLIAQADLLRITRGTGEAKALILEAIQEIPQSPALHHWLGTYYRQTGQTDLALESFAKAIELEPTFIEAYFASAELNRMLGNSDRATSVLDQARNVNPLSADVMLTFAEHHQYLGEGSDAEAILISGSEIHPTDARFKIRLGLFYQLRGEFERAEEYFLRALQVSPNESQVHIAYGNFLASRGKTAQAAERFQTAINLDEGEREAILAAYEFYIAENDFQSAQALLESAVKKNPGRPELHNRLGELALLNMDYRSASTSYASACDLDISNYECRVGSSQVMIQEGDLENAEYQLHAAIQLSPTYPSAHLALAALASITGRTNDANDILANAITESLNKADVYLARAKMRSLGGDFAGAEEDYQAALALRPASIETGMAAIQFYRQQNSPGQADAIRENLISIYGPVCTLAVDLGVSEMRKGNFTSSAEIFRQTTERDANCFEAYQGQADSYQLLGLPEDAILVYQQATAAAPNEPLVYAQLGDLYRNQLEFAAAVSAYNQALELDSMNLQALIGLEKIAQIKGSEFTAGNPRMADYLAALPPQANIDYTLALQSLGLWEEANSLLEQTPVPAPNNRLGWYALGNQYANAQSYQDALAAYQKSAVSSATHFNSLKGIGVVQLQQGQIEEAESTYQTLLELYPGDPQSYILLADFYSKIDRSDQAIETLQSGIDLGLLDPGMFELLGRLYLAEGNISEAERVTQTGLEIMPGAVGLHTLVGNILSREIFDLSDQIQLANANLWWYQYLINRIQSNFVPRNAIQQRALDSRISGLRLELQNQTDILERAQQQLSNSQTNFETAQQAYLTALAIRPSYEGALLGLGRLEAAAGSQEQAEAFYQMAVDANPNSVAALNNLGFSYISYENFEDALPLFEKSAVIDPTETLSLVGRFLAYQQTAENGIVKSAKMTEYGQFWYGNLVERLRAILFNETGIVYQTIDELPEGDEILTPDLDVPASWQSDHARFEDSVVSTYISPDSKAVVQSVVFQDEKQVSRSLALQYALALLNETYSDDISVTSNEIMDDRENLYWQSSGGLISGITGFTIRENSLVVLTTMWETTSTHLYQTALKEIANSVVLGDPIYPLSR